MSGSRDRAWIQTYTGKKFYPIDPDPELICIEDIAHGLSMKCRFNGHCSRFYSVAQHSVLISQLFDSAQVKLEALLHDAAEAYLCDVPSPLKRLPEFEFYRAAEKRLQSAIMRRFGLPEFNPFVKAADSWMQVIESGAPLVMGGRHPEWRLPSVELQFPQFQISTCWLPQMAEQYFLSAFESYSGLLRYEDKNYVQSTADTTAAAA